ncbi:chromatin structure-remodeling complex protein SYD-like [Dorcoceras hygrometricum]|uniref:Chromatin structure-remodeling complex protein SYD-like n=1 Tax=Dorcoceras hygrometricum TaxID=472368 RepID=A0A2Z7CU69_9LAMI|nr:chromatin structure-remodeling complex protein SYD-like [Dorcoceras hygrometricum]
MWRLVSLASGLFSALRLFYVATGFVVEDVGTSRKLLFTVTFLRLLPPLPAVILSDFGGAGISVICSFDCYPFEALNQRWRRSAKLLCPRTEKFVGSSAGLSFWSNAVIGVVTAGFERLLPRCDVLTGPEYHGPMIFTG